MSAAALFSLLAALAGAEEAVWVRGTVRDLTGAAVAGARVRLSEDPARVDATTDVAGRFVLELTPGPDVVLFVEADGFAPSRVLLRDAAPLTVVLRPRERAEEVTVTAVGLPTRLAETPASVLVLREQDLETAGALAVDDMLRQVPGFALFRRTGSRAANPTAQGVSLRGAGASGASRARVLEDGLPLDDPFGGWVYWGRVPRAAVESIDVARGGASHLYGSGALGGVVHMRRRDAAATRFLGEASYGSQDTAEGSAFGAVRAGAWGFTAAAQAFRTDGYVLVDPAARGRVDVPARSEHAAGDLTVERGFGSARAFVRGAAYGETRGNGTPRQTNDTWIRQAAGGFDWSSSRGTVAVRAWASDQRLRQDFTAVLAGRREELLTRAQRVPAGGRGVSIVWSQVAGRHVLRAGAEAREVDGTTDETAFAGGAASRTESRGRQRTLSLFAQDLVSLGPRLTLAAGARLDDWRNLDASRRAAGAVTRLADRHDVAFSPHLALLQRLARGVSLSARAATAFRAPTLNELYRSFRVGDVLTLANEGLGPERSWDAEVGAHVRRGRVSARASAYWLEVEDTVANVTQAAGRGLTVRRRENLGRTRSRGLEADASVRGPGALTLSVATLVGGAEVVSFAADPRLVGRRLPQVPAHHLALQAAWDASRLRAGLQARRIGRAFEDDRNELPLAGLWSLDARAGWRVHGGLELFAAGENLTGERWEVGRTPLRTLGPPRSLRAGVRLAWPVPPAR